jgi:hypothetical protein
MPRYNPLTALWRSMKFPTMVGWSGLCLITAHTIAQKDIALGLMQCGTAVVVAFLISQGIQDGLKGFGKGE